MVVQMNEFTIGLWVGAAITVAVQLIGVLALLIVTAIDVGDE
jgi:hypothetical protein